MPKTAKTELTCIQAFSLRNLVEQVNSLGIKKEDILHLHADEGTFFLLYYK